jgi:hypothetical protein
LAAANIRNMNAGRTRTDAAAMLIAKNSTSGSNSFPGNISAGSKRWIKSRMKNSISCATAASRASG